MPSFAKGGGSHNSHDMRLSGLPGMGLLIYPSLRTYTAIYRDLAGFHSHLHKHVLGHFGR